MVEMVPLQLCGTDLSMRYPRLSPQQQKNIGNFRVLQIWYKSPRKAEAFLNLISAWLGVRAGVQGTCRLATVMGENLKRAVQLGMYTGAIGGQEKSLETGDRWKDADFFFKHIPPLSFLGIL